MKSKKSYLQFGMKKLVKDYNGPILKMIREDGEEKDFFTKENGWVDQDEIELFAEGQKYIFKFYDQLQKRKDGDAWKFVNEE